MIVRSLDILDLPHLPRFQRDVLPLDSARFLTCGNPLSAIALLASLDPRRNVHTAVCSEDGNSLMGQVLLREGDRSARLTFLSPAEMVPGLAVPLLEHLVKQAGERGALHLLAEVDEESTLYATLRQAGFVMYAWQRAWKIPRVKNSTGHSPWRPAEESDWLAVHALHGQIVPALLQPVDHLPKHAAGMVCHRDGSLQAYLGVERGSRGIWLQPLAPPDSGCTPQSLADLAGQVPGWGSQPVYLCVRSYQAWLGPALDELGAEPGPRQAVMVRRLALPIKELQAAPALEKALAKVKPAAPLNGESRDGLGGSR